MAGPPYLYPFVLYSFAYTTLFKPYSLRILRYNNAFNVVNESTKKEIPLKNI